MFTGDNERNITFGPDDDLDGKTCYLNQDSFNVGDYLYHVFVTEPSRGKNVNEYDHNDNDNDNDNDDDDDEDDLIGGDTPELPLPITELKNRAERYLNLQIADFVDEIVPYSILSDPKFFLKDTIMYSLWIMNDKEVIDINLHYCVHQFLVSDKYYSCRVEYLRLFEISPSDFNIQLMVKMKNELIRTIKGLKLKPSVFSIDNTEVITIDSKEIIATIREKLDKDYNELFKIVISACNRVKNGLSNIPCEDLHLAFTRNGRMHVTLNTSERNYPHFSKYILHFDEYYLRFKSDMEDAGFHNFEFIFKNMTKGINGDIVVSWMNTISWFIYSLFLEYRIIFAFFTILFYNDHSHGDVSIRRESSLPTADRRDLDVKRI